MKFLLPSSGGGRGLGRSRLVRTMRHALGPWSEFRGDVLVNDEPAGWQSIQILAREALALTSAGASELTVVESHSASLFGGPCQQRNGAAEGNLEDKSADEKMFVTAIHLLRVVADELS